jgi:zinc transport system substrate-binding protein
MKILRPLLMSAVLLVAACGGAGQQAASAGAAAQESADKLVLTSNYPTYFYASRIVDGVTGAPEIVLPIIDGDPVFWIPNAQQIQQLQSADIVLLNGAGAEPWLDLISLDRRRLIDTSSGITERLIPLQDSVLHQHGPEGEHSHRGTAFTTWLDPQLAVAQAEAVTDALVALAPTDEAQFRENMATLKQDFMAVDARLADVLAKLNSRPVLFSHPVYQYLQRRYGINGESLHWEPDEEPGTTAWIGMHQIRTTHSSTIMIWEDEPLVSTAQRLADAGITSVAFHTLANRPKQGDLLTAMFENAARLESAL